MTDNVVSSRGEPIPPRDREPWIDAAEMLEHLAQRVRAGDVKAVGVVFVEERAGTPQVAINRSLASGQRYNMAVATALLDHRFRLHVLDG